MYDIRENLFWQIFLLMIVIIIFINTIFLHVLDRLTCSGIDALPLFPRASTILSFDTPMPKPVHLC